MSPGKNISIEFLLSGILISCLGILFFLFPYKVQRIDLRLDQWSNKMSNKFPFLDCTTHLEMAKKQSYIKFIRILGLVFLIMGLNLIFRI